MSDHVLVGAPVDQARQRLLAQVRRDGLHGAVAGAFADRDRLPGLGAAALASRRGHPYLAVMVLPRPSSPRRALSDAAAFFRARGKHQLVAGALALLFPAIILGGFWLDGRTNLAPPKRHLIYAESWRADRPDDEILARQRVERAAKDKAARERQEGYKRLERRLGL